MIGLITTAHSHAVACTPPGRVECLSISFRIRVLAADDAAAGVGAVVVDVELGLVIVCS